MIKGTPELIAERREEILNACQRLYQTKSFKEITIKDISTVTSFSRPTIYNYFQTKEEIFLALFEREYLLWNSELGSIKDNHEKLTKEELAAKIAQSIENRKQLLKLLSMNNFDMEANSREELLVSFKAAYGESMQLMKALLRKFCVAMTDEEIEKFIYIFFPFMFGIYPYTEVSEKQRQAMDAAGINYQYETIYELTYNCLIQLLGK